MLKLDLALVSLVLGLRCVAQELPVDTWGELLVEAFQSHNLTATLSISHAALQAHPRQPSIYNAIGVALSALAGAVDVWQAELLDKATDQVFSRALSLLESQPSLAGSGDANAVRYNRQQSATRAEVGRLTRLGHQLSADHRYDEAWAAYNETRKLSPDHEAETALNLGRALLMSVSCRSASRGWESDEESSRRKLLNESYIFLQRALELAPQEERITPATLHAIRSDMALIRDHEQPRRATDVRSVSVLVETLQMLRRIAVDNTVIVSWVVGLDIELSLLVLNLYLSIHRHASRWAPAFAAMASDVTASVFLQEQGINAWVQHASESFAVRLQVLAAIFSTSLDVMLVSSDVVFFGDPFYALHLDADFEVMTSHVLPTQHLWNSSFRDDEHINAGFMFARSTRNAVGLVNDFVAACGDDCDDEGSFSRFIRMRLEGGRCYSLYKGDILGSRRALDRAASFAIRVLDPRLIAHGASYYWLRYHRLLRLERPLVTRASFGQHTQYFMRDRGTWYVDDGIGRFVRSQVSEGTSLPPQLATRVKAMSLPDGFSLESVAVRLGLTVEDFGRKAQRFLRYRPKTTVTDRHATLSQEFLALCAAMEVALALGRRLVLADTFDCRLLPMFEVYGMNVTYPAAEAERCTFDYFADASTFMTRFSNVVVEAGFVRSDYFRSLVGAPAHLGRHLRLASGHGDSSGARAWQKLVAFSQRDELQDTDVLEVGFEDGDDIVKIRDLMRRKLGTEPLGRMIWPCAWVDFNRCAYASRRGVGGRLPEGERRCGVKGLDCCGVRHGWAEKLEYFTGVAWDLPCDCGVGQLMGCMVHSGGVCDHEDEVPQESAGVEALRQSLDALLVVASA